MSEDLFPEWTQMVDESGLPHILRDRLAQRVEDFLTACADAGLSPPVDRRILESAPLVFCCSDFVFQHCLRIPSSLIELAGDGLLSSGADLSFDDRIRSACAGVEDQDGLMSALRRFRNREMARIAWRDLAGWASLDETLHDLTSLAEACLDQALSLLYDWQTQRMGTPVDENGEQVNLVVMGMGKLGAWELNFSSDIDLVFAFPENGITVGAESQTSNAEFFTRLCKDFIRVIGEQSPDGQVFRVDMGLRPDGKNGPLAMSFAAMEQYYEIQGRDWERYAWIKARPVAGDRDAGEELIRTLKPFIYRKYLDYTVFESLREMKRMIVQEVARKGLENDIKTGPGGIREIEFIGQVMQLIRGGVAPELQERAIRPVICMLEEKSLLPADVCRDLSDSYEFLRRTENRIQEFADLQTHKLPEDETGRLCLAVSMGFDGWDEFMESLAGHRSRVQGHFEELLADPEDKTAQTEDVQALLGVWKHSVAKSRGLEMLGAAGFNEPEQAASLLDHLRNTPQARHLNEYGRTQLDRLIPAIIAETGAASQPEVALQRVLALVEAVCRRTAYISLLLENPGALAHLVRLCDASPLIASLVTRQPALLDELLDHRILYAPPDRLGLEKDLDQRLESTDPDDLEDAMDQLRMYKQVNVLRVIAADVTGVLPLMRVSDHLTDIAETILVKSLDMAWNYVTAKHGKPTCQMEGGCDKGFSVVAYGKLGGIELAYGSDLDMVFLHSGIAGQMTTGGNPLYNGAFFARLGQRMIHILSTHTQSGVLYEADMRLRPSGRGGLLVSHMDAFADYQQNQARTWEHQAIVRARPVAGDVMMASRFFKIRKQILCNFRNKKALRADVIKMRKLMKKELEKKSKGMFDVKQGPGGIVDIEFIVQHLVLSRAGDIPALTEWTDNVRLLDAIAAARLLPEATSQALKEAYLELRAHVHALAREDKPALIPEEDVQEVRNTVMQAWEHVFNN